MKVAIIGASGKTGKWLVRQSIGRGYHVVAVCGIHINGGSRDIR